MLPVDMLADSLDGHVTHAEFPADLLVSPPSSDVLPDLFHLEGRQFIAAPPLFRLVDHVIFLGPKEPMRRIAAKRVVAAMQNEQRIRISAMNHEPTESRGNQRPTAELDIGLASLIASKSPIPRPALIR